MISRVIYLWTSFVANTFFFKYDIYLRISTYEHFQVWFSIGKNYIFTTSHKAHHNANGRHGRTNPTVHLLSSIHLHYTFCKPITNNYDILNMGFSGTLFTNG